MAQSVILAEEFALPDAAETPASANILAEFEPPPAREREAVVVDAHKKITDWKKAFSQADSISAGFDLVKEWAGEKAANVFKKNAAEVFEQANTPLVGGIPRAAVGSEDDVFVPGQLPLSILAGAYNAAAGFTESMTTPFNVGTLGAFGALSRVAQGTGKAAKAADVALAAMKVGFGAEMARGAGEQAGMAVETFEDPESTVAQKTEAALAPLITGGLAILSAGSGAKDVSRMAQRPKATNPNAVAEAVNAAPEKPVALSEEFAAPGPEATKLAASSGGPEKLATIQEALKSPDTVIQYSVWDKDMMAPGMERTAQIDLINPKDTKSVGGIASTNRALLAELGVDVPPAPDSLPPGRYTVEQIRDAIAKEATKPDVVSEFIPPEGQSPDAPMVGLGAASPSEFLPVKEFTTSIKNAVVDQEMAARGEPPLMSASKKDFGAVWDEAMAKIDENQNIADELISKITSDPSYVASKTDNAILVHRKIELNNTFYKAARNLRENIGTPDSLAADRVAKQQALDELLALNKISRAAGSEQSAALNTRKLMADQDYSLTSMIEKVSTAKGDVKLTPDEILATEAAHQKILDAQRVLDESAPDQININQAKLDKVKAEFDETLGRFRYEQLSTTRKFISNAADTWDLIRNIYTSGEFSVVLRQGLLPMASRPITTAKAIPKAVKAFLSDEVLARKIDLDTLNSPEAAAARKAGVQLDEPGQKLSQREESIAAEWAKKIPGLRNFNQFSRVFLNKVRVDNFNAMKNVRPDLKPDDLKLIAKYVNQATGRGSLGRFEKNAAELNRVLFSARFQASRLQYLTGNSAWGGNGRTRAIIGREYARTLLGIAAMYSLYELGFSGEEGYKPVSFEPRGTDFGKLHFGPATVDPLAGLSQWIVFGTRTGLTLADSFGVETGGQSITSRGELVSLRNPKFGQDNLGDVAVRFGRSKLHPLVGATWSAATGKDIINQPTSWLQEAEKFVMPMTYEDILQAFKAMDVDQATAVSALAMLGMGLNVQQEKVQKQMMVAPPPAPDKKQQTLPSGKKVTVRPASQ